MTQDYGPNDLLVWWDDGTTSILERGKGDVHRKPISLGIVVAEARRMLTEDQDKLEMAAAALQEFTYSGSCHCRDTTGVTPDGTLVCLDTENCEYAMAYSVLVDDYDKALPGEDYEAALKAQDGEEE